MFGEFLFKLCVGILMYWVDRIPLNYEELNVVLFMFIEPALIFMYAIIAMIACKTKNEKVKKWIKIFNIVSILILVILTLIFLIYPIFDIAHSDPEFFWIPDNHHC